MTQLNGGFSGSRAPFPTIGPVYQHPNEVLADRRLSGSQKRALLAEWASDACAVESAPALRQFRGVRASIDDILQALSALDLPPDPPPGAARPAQQAASFAGAAGDAHRKNLARYRRLLATPLTDLERDYLHRRISEEERMLSALQSTPAGGPAAVA